MGFWDWNAAVIGENGHRVVFHSIIYLEPEYQLWTGGVVVILEKMIVVYIAIEGKGSGLKKYEGRFFMISMLIGVFPMLSQ